MKRDSDIRLRLPCELVHRHLLPLMRAQLARELYERHGLSQLKISRLLDVSQPAVHAYLNTTQSKARSELRKNDSEMRSVFEDLAQDIASGKMTQKDALLRVCRLCTDLRNESSICEMHKAIAPGLAEEACDLCFKELPDLKKRGFEERKVLNNIRQALDIIKSSPDAALMIPEIGMNMAMANPWAKEINDIASIEGGVHSVDGRPLATNPPDFGKHTHAASAVLEAIRHDPSMRAAANIRYDQQILEVCQRLGMLISSFDRSREPLDIKLTEGRTIPWGVEQATLQAGSIPDLIYDKGDVGKEPMILMFDTSALNLAFTFQRIAEEYSSALDKISTNRETQLPSERNEKRRRFRRNTSPEEKV